MINRRGARGNARDPRLPSEILSGSRPSEIVVVCRHAVLDI